MSSHTLMEAWIKTGCHGEGSYLWDATFSVALLGTSHSIFVLFTDIEKQPKCSVKSLIRSLLQIAVK